MNKKLLITGNVLLLTTSLILLSAKDDKKKKDFDVKSFDKSLCLIPKGSYICEDSMPVSGKEKMVSVQSFYMCNHVVTNEEYSFFLNDIKANHPQLYTKMLPDTSVWAKNSVFHYDLMKYYFRHPAYCNYPVVGVSYEQAKEYCKWLTQRYMKEAKRKYKNVVFKLPTVYEWDWAAMGGMANVEFPWIGFTVTNSEKKYKGQAMANYRWVSEQSIEMTGDTGKLELTQSDPFYSYGSAPGENDLTNMTSPVLSYWPNGYGLYEMAGNVEEYVAQPRITKGGSWRDPAYYLQIWAEQHYKDTLSASDKVGFRVAMQVLQ